MAEQGTKQHWDTIVIGGGQAGMATGYQLTRLERDYLILDERERVGDVWRQRWDSLQLFTPAQYDGLAGMPFPAPRGSFPTKDQLADYLEAYASQHRLSIRRGVRVERLARQGSGFELATSAGRFTADQVVVATGTHPVPRIPELAVDLDPAIHTIHSSRYRNPRSIPEGDVLVVGSGTSGVEIALELARTHRTVIAGRPTPHIPDPLLRHAGGLYWWFINNVLTIKTPIGRKARHSVLRGGGPLIRISTSELEAAKVERVPRVVGATGGLPRLEDGRVLSVSTVVWATGYRPDFRWIELAVTDDLGWPVAPRGISRVAGLYFVGMPFQYGLTSGLVGGVSRDAEFVARAIRDRRPAPARPRSESEGILHQSTSRA
jgi:putative flavoprotein involved in K+ transport